MEKCKLLQTSYVAQWIVIYPLTCDQAFIHSLALSTFLVEQISQNTPSLALPCRGAGPMDRGFVVYWLFIGWLLSREQAVKQHKKSAKKIARA